MNTYDGSSPVRIAVLQARGEPGDVPRNLERIARAAREARKGGAEILVTPEMFATGYNIGPRLGEVVTDDLVDRLREVAVRAGIALVVGTGLRRPDGIANAVLVIDAEGTVLARYDKTHLFGDLDRSLFVAGETLGPLLTWRGLRLGLLICYDVEFPENVRALAVAGADLILVPTAQMEPYAFIAEHLIRVRAWESQVAIAYANRVGSEGDLSYVGRSSVVGADGVVLAAAGPDRDELLLATVDPAAIERSRAANPYLRDRRPDLTSAPSPQTAPRQPDPVTRNERPPA
ncbi:carbon-nitrogen hydrolase family protein [Microbacterium sp. JC 701]|uniref:Carbon-nitrogen hydrolase family protein n=1 Tax=Microbacterium algihabitans TaxID=3075992 RepID=A0ABU3RXW2_9MICO|nr:MULTISPECIES: carbon-nitrogen hydrolase family protein [unclassified Microbacterium]MCD2170799.1 carbon-nitrogen hydrolase family protein [Microbacterium sp. JC 701]MDU0327708.1 carbon-nitrogen hydrolase family protein [Microbacterium sp. KSW2-21]